MKITEFILKNEKTIFLAVCFATMLPLFTSQYFVTLDGPSHLHNAKIWSCLAMDPNSFLKEFYSINALMPNVITHLILSLLLTFLPAFIAEKILITAYIFLFAYSFRFLLKSFCANNILFSFFIFPFIFSYPFLLGFYNFSFGIVLLFFTLGFCIKKSQTSFSWKFLLGTAALLFLTYISHLVLFGLLIFILVLQSGLAVIQSDKEYRFKKAVSLGITISLSSILPLFFAFRYFSERPISSSAFESLPLSTLIKYLFEIRPIIAFNYAHEFPLTILISLVFLTMLLIHFVNSVRNKNNFHKEPVLRQRNNMIFSTLALLAITVLYFIFPDSDGRGSYVSIRLGLLIFPFLILFLSLQKFSIRILLISISLVLLAHFTLLVQYAIVNKQVNPVIKEIAGISKLMDTNSLVAVVKETDIWYMSHYQNYVGLDKPMVVLKNYEAAYDYFPVTWNKDSFPNITVSGYGNNEIPCLHFKSNSKGIDMPANYILVIGDSKNLKPACPELFDLMNSDLTNRVHYSANCSLFEL